MELNKPKFIKDIFANIFKSNYNKCAKALNVSPPQLHRIINHGANAGPKFLGKLMVFCHENNLVFDDYIFLPSASTVVNDNLKQTGTDCK